LANKPFARPLSSREWQSTIGAITDGAFRCFAYRRRFFVPVTFGGGTTAANHDVLAK
jgi:hypothetical protein